MQCVVWLLLLRYLEGKHGGKSIRDDRFFRSVCVFSISVEAMTPWKMSILFLFHFLRVVPRAALMGSHYGWAKKVDFVRWRVVLHTQLMHMCGHHIPFSVPEGIARRLAVHKTHNAS